MVDPSVLARRVASIRDATARVRDVLPPELAGFLADRTAREVVALNLFVGIQECIDLAAHWISDEGWDVPGGYAELFRMLATHGVIDPGLAQRLVAASGFRNLMAHRYGALDFARVYDIARSGTADLEAFGAALAVRLTRGR